MLNQPPHSCSVCYIINNSAKYSCHFTGELIVKGNVKVNVT